MEDPYRIAIHEAGHAVCGVLLGGTLIYVAIGKVGAEMHGKETDVTLGSTKCEFDKSWQTSKMSIEALRQAQLNFFRLNVLQSYAGALAEQLEFGEWPDKGHRGDIEKIMGFLKQILVLKGLQPTDKMYLRFNKPLMDEARSPMSVPSHRHAVATVATILCVRKQLDGVQATQIIRDAIANYAHQTDPYAQSDDHSSLTPQ